MHGRKLVAVLVSAGAALVSGSNAGASDIQWVKSYDEAKKSAHQDGSLMMLDFYADW